MNIELSRAQILTLIDAIETSPYTSFDLVELRDMLEKASKQNDYIEMPDGHRLPDERDTQ
jgi:hypothetical protein